MTKGKSKPAINLDPYKPFQVAFFPKDECQSYHKAFSLSYSLTVVHRMRKKEPHTRMNEKFVQSDRLFITVGMIRGPGKHVYVRNIKLNATQDPIKASLERTVKTQGLPLTGTKSSSISPCRKSLI